MKYAIYKEMIYRPEVRSHLDQNEIKITKMNYAGQDYIILVVLEEEEASVMKLKFPKLKLYPYHR